MAIEEQLSELHALETWRLAQLILEENEQFIEAKAWLEDRYGYQALDPYFIAFLPNRHANRVVRTLHFTVENRVRDFNHQLRPPSLFFWLSESFSTSYAIARWASDSKSNEALQLTAQPAARVGFPPRFALRRQLSFSVVRRLVFCVGRAVMQANGNSVSIKTPAASALFCRASRSASSSHRLGDFPSAATAGKFEGAGSFRRRVGLCGPQSGSEARQTSAFTSNEALQLTAQPAGAGWVPSAAFGRSGGN